MVAAKKTSRALRARVLAFVRQHGCPTSRRIAERSYEWDGKTLATRCEVRVEPRIALEYRSAPRPPMEILHDLAHWLLATPRSRSLPEFGLGQAPRTSRVRQPPVLGSFRYPAPAEWSGRFCTAVEDQAFMLGVIYGCHFGLPWQRWLKDGDYEIPQGGQRPYRTITQLRCRGLLVGHDRDVEEVERWLRRERRKRPL